MGVFCSVGVFFPLPPESNFESFLQEVLLPVAKEGCCSVEQEGGGEAI